MPTDEIPAHVQLITTDAQGNQVALRGKPYRGYGKRFCTMFHNVTEIISTFDRPPCYHRCLMFALGHLDAIQWRALTGPEVAKGTGMGIASADRALAMLEADLVIFGQGNRAGKRRRINNNLAWFARTEIYDQHPRDPMPEDARGRAAGVGVRPTTPPRTRSL